MRTPSPITHRRILKIAVPVVLSNATVPILGAVDVGVVGQLGDAAPIGAVAMGAIILTTIFWIFGFLRMGTAGLVGQAAGLNDRAEVSAILTRALMIALAGGLLLILAQVPIFALAFYLSPGSPEVESLARDYLQIRIWTAPIAIAIYALTGWLVAMERTLAVFLVQFGMNGLNILLDLWFVLELGWGVEGVAIATVIAEVVGAGLAFWLCRDAFAHVAWRNWARVFDRAKLVRMGLLNVDILIRSAAFMAIFSSFVFLGAGFGDVILAANEVLLQFIYIVSYAMDGFAFAAEALIARAYGERNVMRLRKAALMCSFWGLVVCVSMAVFFAFAGSWLVSVMAKSSEVQAEAAQYMPWMIAAPVIACASWMLDGIFIGATRGADMRNMAVLSAALYAGAVLAFIPILGNHGLWAALLVSFAARGLTLLARYPHLERSMAA